MFKAAHRLNRLCFGSRMIYVPLSIQLSVGKRKGALKIYGACPAVLLSVQLAVLVSLKWHLFINYKHRTI